MPPTSTYRQDGFVVEVWTCGTHQTYVLTDPQGYVVGNEDQTSFHDQIIRNALKS